MTQAAFSDRMPYHVTVTCLEDMERLYALGIDIDQAAEDSVKAYLSTFEVEFLSAMMFQITEIPDEAGKAHLLYYGKKPKAPEDFYYPTVENLSDTLYGLESSYPGLCRVSNIGLSAQGREILSVTLSDHPDIREPEPVLTLISTLHGDEPVGTVLLVRLIRHLLESYAVDPRANALIEHHAIRFVPLANPDGYAAGERYNASGADLNRSFPVPSDSSGGLYETDGREPEVRALMDWILDRPAAVSLNLHTGSLLVNYPYDHTLALSPDDGLFQSMSLAYASNNPSMDLYSSFENGIVRGAVWYIITGGLQDWAYLAAGELHVTVELSNVKYPDPTELESLWNDNMESFLAYMERADTGLCGRVLDTTTLEPVEAWIKIEGNGHAVYSDPRSGYYCRVLLPGRVSVTAGANGYRSKTVENLDVVEGSLGLCDFLLEKGSDSENPNEGNTDNNSSGDGSGGCFIGSISLI